MRPEPFEGTRPERLYPAVPKDGQAPSRPLFRDAARGQAFQLAHHLHADRAAALQVTALALAKLEVALQVQDKRRYYLLRGRGEDSLPLRTHVSFGEWPLLQRLVYIESEPFERESEREGGGLTEDDLLLRFVKHLVRITTRRNSFYVTLGLSRLLYGYGTADAMLFYQAVVQDPGRTKDDYYFRSRKAVLMREIEDRFGRLVARRRSARGELRFETDPATPRQAELVHQSLRLFTPWETACPVPTGFDPMAGSLPALSSRSPEHEDGVEVARMHALIHPDCFDRMARALRLAPPCSRLEVPRFSTPSGGRGAGPGGGAREPLSAEERGWLDEVLAGEAERRRAARPQVLRVIAGGRERARIDLERDTRITVALDDDPEMVEFRGDGTGRQGILFGVAVLGASPEADGATWALPLVSHPQASVTLSRPAGGGAVLTLDTGHPAASPAAVSPARHDPPNRLWRFLGLGGGRPGKMRWPVFAGAAISVLVGAIVFVSLRPPAAVHDTPPAPGPEDMRSGPRSPLARSLGDVRSLWIDAPSAEWRATLRPRLAETGAFQVTEDLEAADAALKISPVEAGSAYRVRIVNASGQVLWPAGKPEGAVYTGGPEAVAERLGADLQRSLDSVPR